MHLRFLRMTVQFLLLQSCIVCPILMAIHWSSGSSDAWQQQQNIDWNPFDNHHDNNTNFTLPMDTRPMDQFHSNSTLYLLSIANVPNKQLIVWVHVFLLYFISLTWLWLLFVNHWHHLYLLQTCPSTAESTNLPQQSQLLSPPIKTMITDTTANDHHGDDDDDDDDDDGLSNITTSPPISSISSSIPASIHLRSILITNIPHPLRNTAALRNHFSITQVGSVTSVTLVYRAASHALDCALKQRQEWVDQLERRLILLARQIIRRQHKQQQSSSSQKDDGNKDFWLDLPKQLLLFGLPMDDLLTWMHDIRLLDNEILRLRDANLSPDYYKPTGTAFVTFESAHSAQICAQAVTCWKPGVFDTTLAPEPRDIMWSTLLRLGRKDKMVGKIRQWVVFCAVWSLTIFWLFPISFILGLTSIESLSQHFGFLSYFLDTSLVVRSFIQNILPTLLVTLFMSLLPWILLEISKQQDFISYSELEDCVLGRYYHFAIFNVLIVFLLGTSFLSSMLDVLYEPAKIIQLLANSLPQGANFFLNYILFNSATHGMELFQLGSQLFGHLILTLPVFSKTPRKMARYTSPWAFPYYYYYPNHILILVITVTYSVIQPLILIFALFYFWLAIVVYRHQYAFCYIRKYESGGSRHYRRMARYTSDGLLIFQLTMVGLFYLKGVLSAATAILPVIVFTIWMKVKLTRLFGQRAKYPFVGQLSSPMTTAASSTQFNHQNGTTRKTTTIKTTFMRSSNRLSADIMKQSTSSTPPPSSSESTSSSASSLVSMVIVHVGNWIDDIWKFSYLQSWWKHGRYATQREQKQWTFMTINPSNPSHHIQQEEEKPQFVTLDMKSSKEIGQECNIPEWTKHYWDDGCSLYNDYHHPSLLASLDQHLFLPNDPTLRKWKLSKCELISLIDLQYAFDQVMDNVDVSLV
ncbi:uncharacterized protein BX664DRAFT_334989 [Halteromyces radiatus]|uniref:uncharacterized protein n=1 Tax=Halteromyces radiatus TaxID=101107 RepID=UPI00221FB660|nr:uncharacterized protein BX664DRAFT_334989 [Halteromyces radiatus]KAI8086133.1 hypothetical protein BX664DRAFT_334989 [Halteromyces radiatus]